MANQELIRKWVDALRSGDYEQGRLQLRDGQGRYCCLGVLCDISDLGDWNERDEYEIDRYNVPAAAFLPEPVANLAGLSKRPRVDLYGNDEMLSMINDDKGYSFDQIADLIENQYLNG